MKNLTIDINGTCNLECDFCYSELDGTRLNKDEVLNIIQANPDFSKVELGGGEPFIHPELLNIVKQLVTKDKQVHLSTNGTLIPREFLDLDNLDLEETVKDNITVQVSLPAGDRESYQAVTGRNLFETVIQTAEELKENYKTVFSTAIYQRNLGQVKNILEVGYGLRIPTRVNLVFPIGKGTEVDLLTPEQVDQLRGILLVEKIKHQGLVDSPLIQEPNHETNCPALSEAYGLQIKGICPLTAGRKKYYNHRGESLGCEFYRRTGELK